VAEPHRLRRKDLKRPDEFVTISTRVLAWAGSHRRLAIGSGAAVVVLVVAITAALGLRGARDRDANADLARAWARYHESNGSGAASQLAEVGRRWSGAGAGTAAKVLAAAAELRADNAESALVQIQDVLAEPTLPTFLRQESLVAYGFALEKKGQRDEAIAKYGEAAAIDGPYTATAILAEARVRSAAGQKDQARSLYERLQKDFPEVADREQIAAKLATLG